MKRNEIVQEKSRPGRDDGHGRVKAVNPGEVAERVIAVKFESGLSVDARKRGTCQRRCSPAVSRS